MKNYVVIENAGYENEYIAGSFSSFGKATDFLDRQYQQDEIETLHVMIAKEFNGEMTYEF